MIYENLRDLSFEHKAGKLGDADFENLRNSMEEEAAAVLAEIDQLENAAADSLRASLPPIARRTTGFGREMFLDCSLRVGFRAARQLLRLAQAISGMVTNGTTGKPAGGTEVVLVDPMQGMAELMKTTTDTAGKFSLKAGAAQGPRLVRAARDGVNYFRMVTPGTSTSHGVYDAAKSVDRIEGTADVIRIQADRSTLQVVELFAVKNSSSPPRTLTAGTPLDSCCLKARKWTVPTHRVRTVNRSPPFRNSSRRKTTTLCLIRSSPARRAFSSPTKCLTAAKRLFRPPCFTPGIT